MHLFPSLISPHSCFRVSLSQDDLAGRRHGPSVVVIQRAPEAVLGICVAVNLCGQPSSTSSRPGGGVGGGLCTSLASFRCSASHLGGGCSYSYSYFYFYSYFYSHFYSFSYFSSGSCSCSYYFPPMQAGFDMNTDVGQSKLSVKSKIIPPDSPGCSGETYLAQT